jgi:hypothetical protein
MIEKRRLGIGACLAVAGALGFILGPALGVSDLGRPWSFLVGFAVGIMAGLGTALSVAGLAGLRRPPAGGW